MVVFSHQHIVLTVSRVCQQCQKGQANSATTTECVGKRQHVYGNMSNGQKMLHGRPTGSSLVHPPANIAVAGFCSPRAFAAAGGESARRTRRAMQLTINAGLSPVKHARVPAEVPPGRCDSRAQDGRPPRPGSVGKNYRSCPVRHCGRGHRRLCNKVSVEC